MKLLVESIPLRVAYLLFGGLPALYLAVPAAIFGQAMWWAAMKPDEDKRLQAAFFAAMMTMGVIGTISGWLAFFGVGTTSRGGRVTHYVCLLSGILSIGFFVWLAQANKETLLLAAGPLIVGIALLAHLRSAAQQAVPADRPRAAREAGR
jgi:hypothetical protein